MRPPARRARRAALSPARSRGRGCRRPGPACSAAVVAVAHVEADRRPERPLVRIIRSAIRSSPNARRAGAAAAHGWRYRHPRPDVRPLMQIRSLTATRPCPPPPGRPPRCPPRWPPGRRPAGRYQLPGDPCSATRAGRSSRASGTTRARSGSTSSETTGGEIHRGTCGRLPRPEWLRGDGTDGRWTARGVTVDSPGPGVRRGRAERHRPPGRPDLWVYDRSGRLLAALAHRGAERVPQRRGDRPGRRGVLHELERAAGVPGRRAARALVGADLGGRDRHDPGPDRLQPRRHRASRPTAVPWSSPRATSGRCGGSTCAAAACRRSTPVGATWSTPTAWCCDGDQLWVVRNFSRVLEHAAALG